MTLRPHRKPANHPRDIINSQVAICLTLLFFALTQWVPAADEESASETVTLKEAVRIPIDVQGKQVGATTVPAGAKVTVVARDGERVSVKHGALEPVWINESQVSGLAAKKLSVREPAKASASVTPKKLSALISGKKWAEAASACETLAQQDSEKFSSLADLGDQLRSALQAKAAAMAQQTKAEAEAKRLRRNADVVGQPNRLNPSDRSPMERAQKLREQADAVIEEAKDALGNSEAQIAQLGTEISSEVSRLERDPNRIAAQAPPSGGIVSADMFPTTGAEQQTTQLASTSKAESARSARKTDDGINKLTAEAEQGDADAQFALAVLLMAGTNVPRNASEAVNWWRKAADQGHGLALCYLGLMYANGEVVAQNSDEALKLLKQASDQGGEGSSQANLLLGRLFYEGKALPQDYREAAKWLRKAADQGEKVAQFRLATMHVEGKGVPKDLMEAAKLLKEPADQGLKDAQWLLATLYYNGGGVSQDYSLAAELFLKAAEQGEPDSQYRLGMMYKDGIGVAKNATDAERWLRKAADQRNVAAKQALQEMRGGVTPSNVRSIVEQNSMTSKDVRNLKAYSKQFGGYSREEIELLEEEVARVGR